MDPGDELVQNRQQLSQSAIRDKPLRLGREAAQPGARRLLVTVPERDRDLTHAFATIAALDGRLAIARSGSRHARQRFAGLPRPGVVSIELPHSHR